MNNLDTLINILYENKKDIIAVINAKTENIETKIENTARDQIEDRKAILDLQERTIRIEKDLLIRGNTCYIEVQKIKKYTNAFTLFAWISKQKIVSLILFFVLLIIIQSMVYLIFKEIDTLDLINKIFNKV